MQFPCYHALIYILALNDNLFRSNIIAIPFFSSLLVPINGQFPNWQNGSPYLPQSDSQIAVGYVNNTIWLVGGMNHPRHLVSFDISTNESQFTDHGLNHFIYESKGGGHFYQQIDTELWLLSTDGAHLNIFDLERQTFEYHYNNLSLPGISLDGCLTSITVQVGSYQGQSWSYLFIIGGRNSSLLHILDVYKNNWIRGAPSMTQTRSAMSCIAHNNKLYVFGGYNDAYNTELDTIETADISFISNVALWTLIDDKLSNPTANTRAIQYAEYIIIVGEHNTVNVLNTLDDTVSISNSLETSVVATALINVDGVAYAFGGETKQYQMVTLHGTTVYTESGPLDLAQVPSSSRGRTYYIPDIFITFDIYFESAFAFMFSDTILYIGHSDNNYGFPNIYLAVSDEGTGNICIDWNDPDNFGGIEMVSKSCPEVNWIDRWHHLFIHLNGLYTYIELDGLVHELAANPIVFDESNDPSTIWNIFIGKNSRDIIMKNIGIHSRSPFISVSPTPLPTNIPTNVPTLNPTISPSLSPTSNPTTAPTQSPTQSPTAIPTMTPSLSLTSNPTMAPTNLPSLSPTEHPTMIPSIEPTPTPLNEQEVVILSDVYHTTLDTVMNYDNKYIVSPSYYNILSIVLGCILVFILIIYLVKKYKKKKSSKYKDVEIIKYPSMVNQAISIVPGAAGSIPDLPSDDDDSDSTNENEHLYDVVAEEETQKGEVKHISHNSVSDDVNAEELYVQRIQTITETTRGTSEGNITTKYHK